MSDADRSLHIRALVDTDGGVDDLTALSYLALHPRVELLGVIATGISRPAAIAARNARLALRSVDHPDVPIVLGADVPRGPASTISPVAMHGPEGLGLVAAPPPTDQWCANVADVVGRMRGPIDLITLGPLTSTAALMDSGFEGRSITVMGGSTSGIGNALPVAEANVARDPTAAARVIAGVRGSASLLVPLDATTRATVDTASMAAFQSAGLLDSVVLPALAHYRRHAPDPDAFACHDLAAAVAMVCPSLFDADTMTLSVDIGGSAAWGMTVADRRADRRDSTSPEEWSSWRVVRAIELDGFRREIQAVFGGTQANDHWP